MAKKKKKNRQNCFICKNKYKYKTGKKKKKINQLNNSIQRGTRTHIVLIGKKMSIACKK